jgi:hypothetical protein
MVFFPKYQNLYGTKKVLYLEVDPVAVAELQRGSLEIPLPMSAEEAETSRLWPSPVVSENQQSVQAI